MDAIVLEQYTPIRLIFRTREIESYHEFGGLFSEDAFFIREVISNIWQ
jgi:hypothetical protein